MTFFLQEIIKANNTLLKKIRLLHTKQHANDELVDTVWAAIEAGEPVHGLGGINEHEVDDWVCAFNANEQARLYPEEDAVRIAHQILACKCAEMINRDAAQGIVIKGAERLMRRERYANNRKALKDRLSGKKGRIRRNITGKRVDHCARAVISPTPPCFDIGEMGVPDSIMQRLTYPERVFDLNITTLRQRVINGPDHKHGALVVIHGEQRYYLGIIPKDERADLAHEMDVGWIVERNLKNGDWVLLNRQPTLYRGSMMAFTIRRVQTFTFQIHPCVCGSFNADFDGDEMNIHILQTEQERAEAASLLAAEFHIIGAGDNKPRFGLIQTAVAAAYHLTRIGMVLSRADAMQLACQIRYPCKEFSFPEETYTGKWVFSLLLPSDLNMRRSNVAPDEEEVAERDVCIDSGILVEGRITGALIGSSRNGILAMIIQKYGERHAAEFLSDAHRLLVTYSSSFGGSVSIGVEDCLASESTMHRIQHAIEKTQRRVRRVEALDVDATEKESLVQMIVDNTLASVGSIVFQTMAKDNGFYEIIASGAKGNKLNITQVMGCVGQQVGLGLRNVNDFVFVVNDFVFFQNTEH
jgi:DNA-directed RNA polymerase subunit A'